MSLAQKLQGKVSQTSQSEGSSQSPEKVLKDFIAVRRPPVVGLNETYALGCNCRRTRTRPTRWTVSGMPRSLSCAEKERRRAGSASWCVPSYPVHATFRPQPLRIGLQMQMHSTRLFQAMQVRRMTAYFKIHVSRPGNRTKASSVRCLWTRKGRTSSAGGCPRRELTRRLNTTNLSDMVSRMRVTDICM